MSGSPSWLPHYKGCERHGDNPDIGCMECVKVEPAGGTQSPDDPQVGSGGVPGLPEPLTVEDIIEFCNDVWDRHECECYPEDLDTDDPEELGPCIGCWARKIRRAFEGTGATSKEGDG